MDINEVNRVCYVCGKKAGFVPKDKVVGMCMDICDICGKRRACTDLWHDWQKKETINDIVADIREQNLGMPEDMECVSPLVCDMLRLADRIEAAHRRETEKLRALVDGLIDATTIECASCNYDCGPNRENCIQKQAMDYLEGCAE